MFGRTAAFSLSLLLSTALLPTAPAAAQMRTSKDSKPATAPPSAPSKASPNTIQSFSQAIVPLDRPTLALLPAQASLYSPHNDQLYGRLQAALIGLGRFNVLERGKIQALMSERDLARDGYAQPVQLGKLLNAQKLLIAEMTSDPSPTRIIDKKAKSQRFESYARATVRFIDVSTGVAYDAFEVAAEANDSTRERAQDLAMDYIVGQIMSGVRSRTRLSAMVTDRRGRRVHLSEGRNIGIKPGQYFDAVDAYGEHIGHLHVVSAADTQSTAEIIRGYYTVGSGLKVIEQAGGGWPFGIGFANRSFLTSTGTLEGAFNALDLHFNQSGVGWGGGLELGHLSHRGGLSGFGIVGRLEPQMEIVPERFWLYAHLGAGLGLYTANIPSTGGLGSSISLNALASVGANLTPFGGLNMFVDGGYMSPWQLGNWQRSIGETSFPVNEPMPNPIIGGAFARAGVSWAF